jgi:hypothetical protein
MTDAPSSDPGVPPGEAAGTAGPASLPSLPARIVQVFVSPAALFDRLKEVPAWIGMLLVLVVVSVVSSFLLPEEVMRELVQTNLPADAEQEQIDQAVGFARAWGRTLAVVGTPITIAVIAGILILVYNVLLGGAGTFKQLYSATTHAFVIYTVGGLLTLALILSRGEMTTLSLNLLIPGLEEGFLFRLLRGINVFSLWTAAVLGIAVSRIYPKRSAGSATALLIALYLVLAVIFAALGGGR